MNITRHVTFYHKQTGLLHSNLLMASDPDTIALNTPTDHIAIDGHHDHLSQRVDLATGELVDYQPPAPSADHEWDAESKRWQLNGPIRAKAQARAAAVTRIAELEASQHRLVRELLALGDLVALQKLRAVYDEIATLEHLFVNERTAFGLAPLPKLRAIEDDEALSMLISLRSPRPQLALPQLSGGVTDAHSETPVA
jgi:hypothetical protein